MKKLASILVLALGITAFGATESHAQIIVRERAVYRGPVVVRPARPSGRHVWVRDEWVVDHGAYVRRPGYWALPPRPRAVWVGGHWDRRPGGYIWVGGYWR